MKIKEIRELSVAELETRSRDLKQELVHLRLQQQAGQLEKPSQLREIRREVARVETMLTAKRAKAAAPAAAA